MAVLKDKFAKDKSAGLSSQKVLGEEFPEPLRKRLQQMAGGAEKLNEMVLQIMGDYAESFDRLALHQVGDGHALQSKLGPELARFRNDLRELKVRVPDDLDGRLNRLEDRLLEQQKLIAETHKLVAMLIAGDEEEK